MDAHGLHPPLAWLRVGPGEIGLACRYKAGPTVRSTDEGGHADAILPNGIPVGYYARTRRDRRLAILAPGMVRDHRALLRDRPEYMLADEARARRCPTTFCLVDVGPRAALRFARTLAEVGAMPRRWPPPGSPDALFRALHRARPDARIATGFAEFVPEGDGYVIRLDPA